MILFGHLRKGGKGASDAVKGVKERNFYYVTEGTKIRNASQSELFHLFILVDLINVTRIFLILTAFKLPCDFARRKF